MMYNDTDRLWYIEQFDDQLGDDSKLKLPHKFHVNPSYIIL